LQPPRWRSLHAHAQTPANRAARPGRPKRTLRPVVVTATPGVAQRAFDTAASIDALDRETIRDANLQVNLSEAWRACPAWWR
jgi:hypothetical protein